jgi:peptidoglycan/xylan/chitin deacetylase (PgdA/CDA1 family)
VSLSRRLVASAKTRIFRRLWPSGGAALIYHHIGADSPFTRKLAVTIPVAAFKAQLARLESGFQVVPFSKLAADRFDRRLVALTFDDGYRSFLTTALPLLEAARCPVKMFLNSDQVDGRLGWLNKLSVILERADNASLAAFAREALPRRRVEAPHDVWEYWRYFDPETTLAAIDTAYQRYGADLDPTELFLSRADVAALKDHPLIEWGSHTARHLPLERLAPEARRAEIAAGHASLAEVLGERLDGFALPFGSQFSLTPEIAELVEPYDDFMVSSTGSRCVYSIVGRMHELQRIPAQAEVEATLGLMAGV